MKNIDIVVVCVPTPVDDDKLPNLTYINSALGSVGRSLMSKQLVIIESTVYPGYCEGTGKQLLESTSSLLAGRDFHLVHCPERINPGDKKWNVSNIPRVIGGIDDESVEVAKEFYSRITSGKLHTVSNMAEAEASKMVENAFRDINIAFVNELARSFDGTNVDIYSVLEASNTKPFGYMSFMPGLGVGGHCIPVDPYYLIESAKSRNFTHSFLQLAREINDGMVNYVASKITNFIEHSKLENPRIGLLGLTYKPNVADTRESQPLRLLEALRSKGLAVQGFDPFVKSDVLSEDAIFEWADIVVVAVNHSLFIDFESKINANSSIVAVIDAARMLDEKSLRSAVYVGIGR